MSWTVWPATRDPNKGALVRDGIIELEIANDARNLRRAERMAEALTILGVGPGFSKPPVENDPSGINK